MIWKELLAIHNKPVGTGKTKLNPIVMYSVQSTTYARVCDT
jgi:hypothetical protein